LKPSGLRWLFRVKDWTGLAGGISDVAHKGIGAENILLAVTRGNEYLRYIDGAFLGIAHDSMLRAGHADLFVDVAASQASFSHFTTYPVWMVLLNEAGSEWQILAQRPIIRQAGAAWHRQGAAGTPDPAGVSRIYHDGWGSVRE
jgi:hypothetical protein